MRESVKAIPSSASGVCGFEVGDDVMLLVLCQIDNMKIFFFFVVLRRVGQPRLS